MGDTTRTTDRTTGRSAAAKRRSAAAAFTLIEVLLALAAAALIAVISLPAVSALKQLSVPRDTYYQDETGIYQLQIELAVNDLEEVGDDFLRYRTLDNECTLHVVNGKLISQPGTLDFIHGIDWARFESSGGIVYLRYPRGDQEFVWPVAYEEGP